MKTLSEQVTFKVSRETLEALQARGKSYGLDANPYARKLVEAGLETDRSEDLADELRELLTVIRPMADRLSTTQSAAATTDATPGFQVEQLGEELGRALLEMEERIAQKVGPSSVDSHGLTTLADQLIELRADLNKTFAALLHYQMNFSVEEAQRWVDARLNAGKR